MTYRISVAFGLMLSLGSTLAAASETAETILLGKIYTADSRNPLVEAVAIKGGRFLGVGDREAVMKLKGPDTRVQSLGANTAYPGFIDSHLHIAGVGATLQSVDLRSVASFDALIEKIAARAQTLPAGTLIVGTGWHQSKWNSLPEGLVEGFPVHDALSAATPDHPVLLSHANGHTLMLNGAAMRAVGLDAASVAPEGGVIVKDSRGRPTGLLHESAQALAADLERYDVNKATELLRAAQAHILSQGITSAHDAGVSRVDLQAQRRLAESRDLTLRVYSMVAASDEAALSEWLDRGTLLATDDQRLTVRSIKVVADGALGSRTAWLNAPYTDAPDTVGVSVYSPEALQNLVQVTRNDDWQINVHAIGDRANREVLDVFEATLGGGRDHRFRIEHAQHLRPEAPARFAELGVIASMQPIHLSSDRPWAIDRLGEQRIEEGAYMWQKLLSLGVVVASGTDAPVEPVNPLANFFAAISRKQLSGLPEGGYESAQKMTREQALHAMTLAGAYAAFEERDKGSVAIGKLADLTVLSADIMVVPEADILKTEVDQVWVGGEVAYQRRQ